MLSGCSAKVTDEINRTMRTGQASFFNKLNRQWKGTPVAAFQKRFGAPSASKRMGNSTAMTWHTSEQEYVRGQLYDKPIGPKVSISVYEPAHYKTSNCIIEVTAQNGKITNIKTLDDSPINGSLCQKKFGA